MVHIQNILELLPDSMEFVSLYGTDVTVQFKNPLIHVWQAGQDVNNLEKALHKEIDPQLRVLVKRGKGRLRYLEVHDASQKDKAQGR